MGKRSRTVLTAVGVLAVIAGLHLWQNVGLEKVGLAPAKKTQAAMRVGFLPVT
jgi:hypothetical protein